MLATVPGQILSLLASKDGQFVAGPEGPLVVSSRFQIPTERPPDLDSNLDLYAAIRGTRSADVGVGVLLSLVP